MSTRTVSLVVVAVFVLIVAACGGSDEGGGDGGDEGGVETTAAATNSGDDGGSTETTAAAVTGDDGGEGDGEAAPEQPEVGEAGSFTVNGTAFTVTFLNRCIPFTDGPGNIDLQALAQGQGAMLNLYVAGDSLEVSVDGSGIQEMFGSIAFGAADQVVHESTTAGDRWTGSATVGDSLETVDPVDISWDVMIPSEVRDCSL